MSPVLLLARLLPALDPPPLDPSGQEARRLLRRELVRPEYHDANIVQRIMDWVQRLIDDSVDGASNARPLAVAAAIVVTVLILAGIIAVLSRLRRTARADAAAPALTDEVITADELRARAEAALADGDPAAALVDAFRAAAVRQVERGRIDDLPQATAHELGRALGVAFPDLRDEVDDGADRFDLVLYGDRPATPDQARRMLDLDDRLRGSAVRR